MQVPDSPSLVAGPYATPVADPVPEHPTEGRTLEQAILDGERFIEVPYVVSIVILSFRRSMGVHLVGETPLPMGKVVGATVITALFGWWGIPFGLFWTINSLFHLWWGGRDMTKKILTETAGPAEAKRILSSARPRQIPASIWIVRFIILLAISPILYLIAAIVLDNRF